MLLFWELQRWEAGQTLVSCECSVEEWRQRKRDRSQEGWWLQDGRRSGSGKEAMGRLTGLVF